ncbi:MotE family protein [Pseudoruegeria sp. SK021]|uniref:MotE family protein n=1 Tax=Pseudoruegeria sp. SK021 TaxID=1933035 RepID=UPI001F0B3C5E|nr:hypothetical protein [Pseudoruegeria sp. SK021]
MSLVIASLFCASVVVRLLGGTAEAIAKEVAALTPSGPSIDATTAPDISAAEVNDLLAGLTQRAQALDQRRDALDERERDLDVMARLATAQLAELQKAESSLSAMIALAETAAEGDIVQLITVYENMKPKEAAQVFEEMDPQFAAGFLGRMRADTAAQIFSGLQPATAYSISVILAGRNVDVPTE